jgi:hypothetical protein
MGILDEKVVAENDQWKLTTNFMTKGYQRRFDEYSHDGFTLNGRFTVVYAENKLTDQRVYLAMDNDTGQPYADWYSGEEFEMKFLCMMEDLRDECNIVEMAKKVKKKRGKRK